MKKPSKQVRSNLLNALVILGTIGIVIYLGARGGNIGASIDAIMRSDWRWFLLALLCWGLNIICESMVNQLFFIQQKVNVRFCSTLHITLLGQFYSSVTPAATGGQPMQVFAFKKRGVPAGVSSSALAVKFFCFQAAVLSLGAVLWILQPEFVSESVGNGKWLIWVGFLINGLTVTAVILLAISRNMVRAIIVLALKLGKALHIVKDLPRASSRADAALEDFRASVDMITHHPLHIIALLLLSYLQIGALMSVAYCVCRALGLHDVNYFGVMTLQLLLFIGAAFSPLPGASGAQEGGFALFFGKIIPGEIMVAALLMWRFATYYIAILVGLCDVIGESAMTMRRNAKISKSPGELPDESAPEEAQLDAAREIEPTPDQGGNNK